MRRLTFVLTCFAAANQGRRLRSAVEDSQGSEAFAALLLLLNPTSSFKPSAAQAFGRLGRSGPASSQARQMPKAMPAMSTTGVQVEDPPTTLLGGFLGAGKTTALTHLLTNRDGLKIAVLVNDVAAVNVDAATMRRRTIEIDGVEMLELENGCVCCGPAAGELPAQVRSLSSKRAKDGSAAFDHVVVELSGVADPTNVEKNLRASNNSHITKVALVDSNSFPGLYNSVSRMGDRDDLAGEDDPDPCTVERKVVELLLAQIESADVILVNKCDLASDDELQTTLTACRALNSEAEIVSTTFGDAKLENMLPLKDSSNEETPKKGVKPVCTGDSKKDSVSQKSKSSHKGCKKSDCSNPDGTGHADNDSDCTKSKCASKTSTKLDCSIPDRTGDADNDPDCTKPKLTNKGCTKPDCTKPDCTGDHDTVPNSIESIGFQTYVYRARRPFSQERLVSLVRRWPLPKKKVLSLENIFSPGAEDAADGKDDVDTTFANVLRSKGTAWLESEHSGAAEWSHAGRHFSLNPGGAWWAILPPEIMRAALSSSGEDTTEESEAYKVERSNFAAEFGDRRQEIVFIGTSLDTDKIKQALDECLLTDEEMKQYVIIFTPEEERIAAGNGPFRFDVGTKVECNIGGNWERGIVVKQYYREAEWPPHRWNPYLVHLDNDMLIWAPADMDSVIRRV